MPRGVREAFGGAAMNEMTMASQLDSAVMQYEATLMENIASNKDFKKEMKKMLDVNDSELPGAIHEYVGSLKNVPYYKRGQVLGQLSNQLLGILQTPDYVPSMINVDPAEPIQPTAPDYSGMTPEERINAQFQNAPGNVMLDRLYNRTVGQEVKQPYLMNTY
jgi:hypothetical protein